MTEADTETRTGNADDVTADSDTFVNKARQAAADIDVDAMMGRAKNVASDVKDKSMTAAVTARDKVRDFVGTNESKIDDAIDRTGQFVDQKVTRQKFSDQIGKVSNVAKGAVNKVGQPSPAGDAAASTDGSPTSATDETPDA